MGDDRNELTPQERDRLADALDRFSEEASALTGEVKELRTTVIVERKGRRLSTRLFFVALLLIAVLGSGYIADLRAKDSENCRNRVAGRSDVRSAIDATVDEVALYFNLSSGERVELRDRAALRVKAELPTPDC